MTHLKRGQLSSQLLLRLDRECNGVTHFVSPYDLVAHAVDLLDVDVVEPVERPVGRNAVVEEDIDRDVLVFQRPPSARGNGCDSVRTLLEVLCDRLGDGRLVVGARLGSLGGGGGMRLGGGRGRRVGLGGGMGL